MSRYIDVDLAIDEIIKDMCGVSDIDEGLGTAISELRLMPTADVVEVVRCKDCKFRIVNEHYGEDGYMKLKAICDKDTGDPFELGRKAEDDEWFCADGERREDAEIH